jgi:hypothetical protein
LVDFPRRVSQPPKKLCESFMDKEVSIVLSVERKNHRKLAQEWYGLTDEQMIDMDVHHNPPRHQGGRNIPEHLFVYHNTLHHAVHGYAFTIWARTGGVLGAKAQPRETRIENGRKNGKRNLASLIQKNPNHQREAAKAAVGSNREKGTAVFDPRVQSQGGFAVHQKKGEDGKSIHAKLLGKISTSQKWEDPNHPELGTHNAGNLVKIQKSKGLPHGPENRRRVE